MALFKHTVRFMLQQDSEIKKLTPLRCIVRYNNQRVVFTSGVSIEPRYWVRDKKNKQKPGELKKDAGFADYKSVKVSLFNIEQWVGLTFDKLVDETGEYPAPEVLKERCLGLIKNKGVDPGAKTKQKKPTLFEFMERVIAETKAGRRVLSNGDRYSHGTLKGYSTKLAKLKKYHEYKKGQAFEFNDIDIEFYNDFKDWCYNVEKISNNYFGSIIKFVKLCMNEAKTEGLHNSEKHKSKYFVKVKTEVDNVYLSDTQLDILLKHDFSDNPKLARARDLFLVGCWTGLRFGDFANISPNDIQGDFLIITTQKTGVTVPVPILPQLKEIMDRYKGTTNNSLPPPISNVNLNLYIKDAAKEAGLADMISLEKSIAGKKAIINKPLYQLITTHSARRSFASNMYKMGAQIHDIMEITGHKNIMVFLNYIKVTPTEKAERVREVVNRNYMKAVNSDI